MKHVSMLARHCPAFAAVAIDDVAADHLTTVELGDQGTAHTVAAGVCAHLNLFAHFHYGERSEVVGGASAPF